MRATLLLWTTVIVGSSWVRLTEAFTLPLTALGTAQVRRVISPLLFSCRAGGQLFHVCHAWVCFPRPLFSTLWFLGWATGADTLRCS